MKQLFKSTPKEYVATLPQAVFKGRIVVISTITETQKAIQALQGQTILGIDTETKPAFKKGVIHKVSLLQISTNNLCFLFRLNLIGLPKELISILEDPTISKIGLSLKDDLHGLCQRAHFTPAGFIDLQNVVKVIGVEDMSLQKLYANLFGYRISKSARLTNWDNDVLTDSQKHYAALDAYACIQLYTELTSLIQTKNYTITTAVCANSNPTE